MQLALKKGKIIGCSKNISLANIYRNILWEKGKEKKLFKMLRVVSS